MYTVLLRLVGRGCPYFCPGPFDDIELFRRGLVLGLTQVSYKTPVVVNLAAVVVEVGGKVNQEETCCHGISQFLGRVGLFEIGWLQLLQGVGYNVSRLVNGGVNFFAWYILRRKLEVAVTYVVCAAEYFANVGAEVAADVQAEVTAGVLDVSSDSPNRGFIRIQA